MITQAYKNIKFILYSLILDAMKDRIDTQLVLKTIIFKTKCQINSTKAQFKSKLYSLLIIKISKFIALSREDMHFRNLILILPKVFWQNSTDYKYFNSKILYQLIITVQSSDRFVFKKNKVKIN